MSISLSIRDEEQSPRNLEEVEVVDGYVVRQIKRYILNPKSYNNIFKVLFGNSMILLFIVLFSDASGYDLPLNSIPINHWTYQIANALFLLSYASESILYLRIILSCGAFWFMIWMYTFEGGMIIDGIMWNYITLLINIRHTITLIYAKRPIVLDNDREGVYKKFDGIMSKADFKILSKNAFIRELGKDRYYSQRGDECNNLSILISGQIMIVNKEIENSVMMKDDDAVSYYNTSLEKYVNAYEFIDSPEWIMRKSKHKFSVSMLVVEKCRFLIWPYEILNEVIEKHPHLESPLLGVLGKDVANKVFKN
jgi:hypothetical protein